jgi:hypothetical protein
MGRAPLFRSDEPHIVGFGSGVVQETRYGTAAMVKIGIGWQGEEWMIPYTQKEETHQRPGELVFIRGVKKRHARRRLPV